MQKYTPSIKTPLDRFQAQGHSHLTQ